MGIFDTIRDKALGQFIDVIDWVDTTRNTLVWKYPRGDNEIKNGAQLIVRESQAAVFIYEGQLGDVFGPGRYELTTQNIPILTSLRSWKYGFNSPFKADVYYVNTRNFTDQKWGTSNPIMLRDAEFGPIRLRAFGNYAFTVTDPGKFIITLAGTNPLLVSEDVTGQLRNLLVSRFTDALGSSNIPALDLAANYTQLSDSLRILLQRDFDTYGITLTTFLIENISVPPAVEEALDKRAQIGVLGDLNRYTQFQAANALEEAARNPGAAGNLVGMLAGVNLGNIVSGNLQNAAAATQSPPSVQTAPDPAGGPPPVPGPATWYLAINGRQEGPFDAAVVTEMASRNQVTSDTLVWKHGMENWSKAGDVPDLSGLFQSAPPPLPPPLPLSENE